MKKKPRQPVNMNEWQTTYGDMVTLLLCFFVMLYSMSSIDSAKWEMIVKSFNPLADKVSQIVTGEVTEGADNVGATGTDGIAELETIEQLFQELQKYVDENGMANDVMISEGDGYVFITFRNNIFFNEDSAVLREENKSILNFLASGLAEVAEDVNEVRVFGHTNQADPSSPNAIDVDRNLSSLRASTVVSYLQKQNCIDPRRLSGVGYGQWYPVAPYDTPENRQQNRRVEILISKAGTIQPALDEIYADMGTEGSGNTVVDLQNHPGADAPGAPDLPAFVPITKAGEQGAAPSEATSPPTQNSTETPPPAATNPAAPPTQPTSPPAAPVAGQQTPGGTG